MGAVHLGPWVVSGQPALEGQDSLQLCKDGAAHLLGCQSLPCWCFTASPVHCVSGWVQPRRVGAAVQVRGTFALQRISPTPITWALGGH